MFGVFKMADVNLLGNACSYATGFAVNGLTTGGVIGALLVEIILTGIFLYNFKCYR